MRCTLDRAENMRLFGGRDACEFRYKVGVSADGRITALDVTFYSDVGYTMDVSPVVSIYDQCETSKE